MTLLTRGRSRRSTPPGPLLVLVFYTSLLIVLGAFTNASLLDSDVVLGIYDDDQDDVARLLTSDDQAGGGAERTALGIAATTQRASACHQEFSPPLRSVAPVHLRSPPIV